MTKLTSVSIIFVILAGTSAHGQNATLDIYWIDVEGGAATLIVAPARESILMDAGWDTADERDTSRIEAAMYGCCCTNSDLLPSAGED